MKKILLGMCAIAAIATASCDKSPKSESPVDPVMADSIATLYGRNVGYYLLSDFANFQASTAENIKKDDVIRGIQTALSYSNDRSTITGLQIGLTLAMQLQQLKDEGIEVDHVRFINSLKQTFLADTLDNAAMQDNGRTLADLMQRAETLVKNAQAAEDPAAVQNLLAGRAYVDQQKAADPEIKTSESGLSYKIENAGEGVKPNRGDFVRVNYTGKLPDGTIFDQGENAEFEMARLTPGFAEGLMMLAPGGKATLYVPADLAYGAEGVPSAGIGPNQLLVFDVELLGVGDE